MMFREDQFTRTKLLIGERGMDILRESKVMIFGIGGVGSFITEALARAGIGHFILIDFDVVASSNINRQLIALHSTVGRPKVDVMKERILDINPQAVVETKQIRYDHSQAEELFAPKLDYVIDAIDDVQAKVDLAVQCKDRGLKYISSMGTGKRINAKGFTIADISDTYGDPLAKKMRKLLKEKGITSGIKVVYTPEPAMEVQIEDQEGSGYADNHDGQHYSRKPIGSISFVPSVSGLLIAGEVVRNLVEAQ